MEEILKIVLSLLFWIRNLKLDPTYDINSMIKKMNMTSTKYCVVKKVCMYMHIFPIFSFLAKMLSFLTLGTSYFYGETRVWENRLMTFITLYYTAPCSFIIVNAGVFFEKMVHCKIIWQKAWVTVLISYKNKRLNIISKEESY